MFLNHLKIAFRALGRGKIYTILNITGLALGLACFGFISAWVLNELSYDRFHEKHDRIYRLTGEVKTDSETFDHAVTSPPMAAALQRDFPEVENAVRLDKNDCIVRRGDKQFLEDGVLFTDPSFFEIFSYRLTRGNATTALNDPYSLVLTESMARKYFGDENPLGQQMTLFVYDPGGQGAPYTVTGVLPDPPQNAHFTFNFLGSFNTMYAAMPEAATSEWLWFWNGYYTYLLLKPGTDPAQLQQKLPAFADRYLGEKMHELNMFYKFSLQPISAIHLHSDLRYEIQATGSIDAVYIFATVGLFILLIACINYMNLATARSLGRAREVGVKKVVGARPIQLIRQFLVESILLAFLALLASQLLMELAQPLMTQLTGKPVALIFSPQLLLLMVLVTLLAGLFAGCYPAFFIAAFKPVEVLKGAFKSTAAGISLRQALVVFQFVIATVLLAGMGVINAQMDFIRSKDLGFKRDALVTLDVNGYAEVQRGMEAFRNDLLANSTVEGVTTSRGLIVNGLSNGHIETVDNAGAAISSSMYRLEVGLEYLSVYGINLLAGRDFDPAIPTDTAEAFIVNRAAVEMLGWGDPAQAIGKPFKRGNMSGRVIGVARDFHFASLHKPVEPVSISLTSPRRFSRITLRIRSERLAETLTFIRQTWQTHFPEALYQLNFMNDRLNQQYRQEQQFRDIFQMFVVISLIIAGLGLFGLASYAVTQRVKEIGIRKVLGAPVSRIILLVSRDFLKLVILACIIACPLAYWIMNRWLQDFAYRAEIGPGVFLLAAAAAIVVAALTISYQSIRAALADPVKALRSE